jgi:hypothetical protein
MFAAWLERRRRPTRSTRWPSPGGGRSWTCSPPGSGPSATSSRRSAWRSRWSKHLRVLREVGLVRVREEGRQRLYRLDGRPLEPVHEWVRGFAWTWERRFERMDEVLKELEGDDGGTGE